VGRDDLPRFSCFSGRKLRVQIAPEPVLHQLYESKIAPFARRVKSGEDADVLHLIGRLIDITAARVSNPCLRRPDLPRLKHGLKTRATAGLLLLSAGCARLEPGTISKLDTPPQPVILIRGYLDWYSTGIDTLATEIRAAGIPVETFREEQWGDVADRIIAGRPTGRVRLIGFSYGADDAVLIAHRLADKGIPVRLLVTIDPVTPDDVPPNVSRCVDFYEPNGFWDIFPWLRGIPLHAEKPETKIENIDIRARPDLIVPETSHASVAANPNVHKAILELLRESAGR
jgi:pimeloyl-ACP methyl ester carboxylesterase